jgi:RNA polymerase sigma factor (sigma-70 family)
VRAGDPDAFGVLYDRWFDRVHDLAYRIVYDENAAADVAQDAFLSAWRNLDRLEDAHAFGGWLLRIARNGALDRKRGDQRARPVDDEQLAMIERAQIRPEDRIGGIDDPARVAEDASYAALLWDAADALGERDQQVLDLTLRHGLAPAEVGDVMDVNRNAANQLVHRVRQRLATAVGARVLWRSGAPSCAALRAELVAADVERFGADAVRVTDRHAAGCDECATRRRLRLDPAKMFAAIPMLSIPALKAKAAYALSEAGVPMSGSQAFDGDNGDRARRGRGRTRRVLLGSGAAIAVMLVVLIATVNGLDRDPVTVVDIAHDASTTTTAHRASSTTSFSSSTTSTVSAPVTTVPVVIPPATPPTAPATITTIAAPTTTTIPPRIRLSISQSEIPAGYPMDAAPTLSWSVLHAARAHASDSVGVLDENAKSGAADVCPGTVAAANNVCTAKPGTYVYSLDAYDAAGHQIGHTTVSLTVL